MYKDKYLKNFIFYIFLFMFNMVFLLISPLEARWLGSNAPQTSVSDIISSESGENSVDISADSGGYVIDYAIKMFKLKEIGTRVRFTGRCDSACTLYLALPTKQTCVGEGAYFRFHSPQASTSKGIQSAQVFLQSKYPAWVRDWIDNQGGLSTQLLTMNYDYARQFMPRCSSLVAHR
jgi:hypothetical protein